jgi:hypothetical protein
MSALDEQDFVVIYLALDMLGRHSDTELAEARLKGGNSVKQMALIAMRQRVANVRVKLQAMEVADTHGRQP